MRQKNSLLFIRTFLLSIVVASPFLIKQVIFKKEDFSPSENMDNYEEEIKDNSNTNSVSNPSTNKTNTNISNSKTNSNSNKEPTNSNSNKPSNENPSNPNIVNQSFVKVDDDYFEDALFIGDSRTVGIKEYGKIKKATFFCDTGMSIYNLYSKKLSISGVGKVSLKELLKKKKYGKIYIMLGINEIGYNMDKSAAKFEETVNYIKKAQPDAIIFIQGNLHVSKEKSEKNPTFSNKRIDKYNKKLSKIADFKTVFYFDANEIFDDGKGNMKANYTFDNTHIYAKYFVNWKNYMKEHAVLPGEPSNKEEENRDDSNVSSNKVDNEKQE